MAHARISGDKRYIEIYNITPSGFVYDISLEGCRTYKQKVEWIEHLQTKNWWSEKLSVEVANLFMDYA